MMNRRTKGRKTRVSSGVAARFFSLVTFAMVLWFASSVFWAQASAQDKADGSATASPAPKIQTGRIPTEPYQVWKALGLMGFPLALTSVVVVWFSIERLVALRYGRVIPRHFVKRFFEHMQEGNLDPKVAIKLCEDNGSPIALVLANGVRKWGKSSVEVEQAIIDGGERQVSQLRKHIRVLNGCSTVSPLLGLLGTVLGMIKSFNEIASVKAMGKSEMLAEGIGLSLLCTAAGLAIAIPSLIMYMYFTGKVDVLVIEMDGLAQQLVDLVSAEGLADQARAGAKAAAAKPESRRAV